MRSLSHLSIKSKLILMLLAVSSASIFVTAYLGYRSGQVNLTSRVFNQLTSVRASKAYQIESYFKTIRNHTQTLSENPSIIAALQEFDRAYQQLQAETVTPTADRQLASYYQTELLTRLAKVETGTPVLESYLPKTIAERYLQDRYIAANPNPVGKKHLLDSATDPNLYNQVHRRYHPIFRTIIQKFGYYDMFLINLQGNIVYTVFKETDFSTSLQTGPYKDSNLAQLNAIVQAAKERDYAWLVDFQRYSPSYGAPAAFVAAPIFNGSELIGVLAFQLPVDEINRVMTGNQGWSRDGLGKSGETYLVGSDSLMRSVSRFLVEDPKGYSDLLRSIGVKEADLTQINQYRTSILQQQVKTKAVEDALIGRQGTQIIQDYRDIPVLSSYAPLQIEGLNWVILSEMDLAEAYEPIYSFQRQILISATFLMVLVTILAMGLAHLFVQPINRLIISTRKVAAGDLDTVPALETGDEFGELGQSFNAMVTSLRTQTNLVAQKSQENEQLLLSVFPASIAQRLKRGEKHIAEDISNVAILFSDLTGFAKLSSALNAYESVTILNDLVSAFDEAAERYGMEKIKTIGDSYLAVCGLSVPYLDHDKRAIDFGLEMLTIIRRFNLERGFELNTQIGIHAGDVVAGIVGRNKVIYDVWGDAINLTSTLKDACPAGGILVSEVVYHRLQDLYQFESVSQVETKAHLDVKAWRLKSTRSPIESKGLILP